LQRFRAHTGRRDEAASVPCTSCQTDNRRKRGRTVGSPLPSGSSLGSAAVLRNRNQKSGPHKLGERRNCSRNRARCSRRGGSTSLRAHLRSRRHRHLDSSSFAPNYWRRRRTLGSKAREVRCRTPDGRQPLTRIRARSPNKRRAHHKHWDRRTPKCHSPRHNKAARNSGRSPSSTIHRYCSTKPWSWNSPSAR
jgi:hypothetical protein